MFGLGAGEIVLILILALIFIGPKKLPELAKGLGRGLREFQRAKSDIMDQVHESEVEEAKEAPALTEAQEEGKVGLSDVTRSDATPSEVTPSPSPEQKAGDKPS